MRSIPVVDINAHDGEDILKKINDAREKRDGAVTRAVSAILEDVRVNGDMALFKYTKRFDRVNLTESTLRIPKERILARAKFASLPLQRSIREAAWRIREYHSNQGLKEFKINTPDGALKQVVKPLRRVGVYIPGGHTVYPSSVLMNVIPAQIAGVREIAVVTPPRGELDAGVAFALRFLGINELYQAGGAQAIGALAYGTKSIAPVDKIVGPGSSYIAAAKRLVYGRVDIDTVAGPSEVVIIADESAPPRLVALDLLAQAEHGSGDEIALCIVESKAVAAKIAAAVVKEINASPVRDTFMKLPSHAIAIFVTRSRKESLKLADEIAPEHLQIMTAIPGNDIRYINNAAAVFLGVNTPAALGDYFIGTNHVLPTGGAARFASPLSVESFQKRISMVKVSTQGVIAAGELLPPFARAESFIHHAICVEARAALVNTEQSKNKRVR
jgi:histidinol dehydrogenase